MDYPSIVGGRTALEEQGFGHYLKLSDDSTVHLYGDRHPTWLKRLGTTMYAELETSAGSILCSSPERAVLEMLDELPSTESFHIVDAVFEGLASARPARDWASEHG